MTFIILALCAWYGLNILAAGWLHFKERRPQRMDAQTGRGVVPKSQQEKAVAGTTA